MTVSELVRLLETCEDTFDVIVEGGTLHYDETVTRVEQILESKCVRICTSEGGHSER